MLVLGSNIGLIGFILKRKDNTNITYWFSLFDAKHKVRSGGLPWLQNKQI
jgi:hypothetical protein